MAAKPSHGRLEDLVELLEVRIRANQQASPDGRPDAFQRQLELMDSWRATSTAPGDAADRPRWRLRSEERLSSCAGARDGPAILTAHKRIEFGQQALTNGAQAERSGRVGR